MIEALAFEFVRNAIWAGILSGIACGIVGALIVVNRLVFLAGGISHATYGGVGLAFYMGWPVLPSSLGFTLGASLLMAGVGLKHRERADALIGVMWAAGMAFGIIMLDLSKGYNVDLMSYLFGSILAVPVEDLHILLGLDLALILVVSVFYKGFLALSFDPDFAATRGAPVRFLYLLLISLLAVSIVMVIKVVGLILVIALLTIPPYIVERRARTLGRMMLWSAISGIAFCLGGLALAYTYDLTSGASIIAVATAAFFADQLLARLHKG